MHYRGDIMKTIRSVLNFWMIFLLAAFALTPSAALAADKEYSVTVSLPTSALSSNDLTFLFKNLGNSNWSSLSIAIPTGYSLPGGAASVQLVSRGGVASVSGGVIQINSINLPIGAQQTGMSVTLRGVTTACGIPLSTWTTQPYTGSTVGGGSKFTLTSSPAQTTMGSPCTLSFGTQPKDTLLGTKITGTAYKPAAASVTVSISGGNALITVDSANCALDSTSTKTVQSVGGVATFNNLITYAAGANCTLNATAPGATGATSLPYDVKVGSLAFVLPPANVLSGAAITSTPYNNPAGASVAVQLRLNGVPTYDPAFDGTAVNVAAAGCLASGASVAVSGGVAKFSALTATNVTTPSPDLNCNLGASATNFTSPATAPFIVKASGAPLACGGQLVATGNPTDPLATFYVDGNRGALNKDGLCPAAVNYSFVTDPAKKTVSLIWDTTTGTGQPNAAFKYTVTSAPLTFPNGWPAITQPNIGWKVYDPGVAPLPSGASAGDPVFIKAQGCVAPILPKQYGTASIDGAVTSTSLSVTLSVAVNSWPSAPFPIVMEAERMLVTLITPVDATHSTWTVQRGDGMTTPAVHAGAPVMSTPLPLLTATSIGSQSAYYTIGKPAQMCIASQSWGSSGFVPGQIPGVPQIIYFTTVFDIGDGWFSSE